MAEYSERPKIRHINMPLRPMALP